MLSRKSLDSHILELRRGAIVVVVLSCLQEERYGYSLRQKLSEAGLEVSEGTLYPLMRRLEDQGYLGSEWRVAGNRPRRYYKITPLGIKALEMLTLEWRSLVQATESLLG